MGLTELDDLLPWERTTYFSLHLERLEQEKETQTEM